MRGAELLVHGHHPTELARPPVARSPAQPALAPYADDWVARLDAARARLKQLHIKIPAPFDLFEFSDRVATRLNIRIKLVPVQMSAVGSDSCFGATMLEGTTHYVFWVVGMSHIHSLHNAVHEHGHIILGHAGVRGRCRAEAEADALAAVVLSRCEPPRRRPSPPAHLRRATARLTSAWQ
jgi:hypothetical protein